MHSFCPSYTHTYATYIPEDPADSVPHADLYFHHNHRTVVCRIMTSEAPIVKHQVRFKILPVNQPLPVWRLLTTIRINSYTHLQRLPLAWHVFAWGPMTASPLQKTESQGIPAWIESMAGQRFTAPNPDWSLAWLRTFIHKSSLWQCLINSSSQDK